MARQARTPDEIKKGLEACSIALETNECPTCPYYKVSGCADKVLVDALALIQQLEAEDAEKAQRIAELEKELAAAKRERDAAVDDLKKAAASGSVCTGCIHMDSMGSEEANEMCQQNDFDCLNCHPGCVCKACLNNSLWQWRGVCPENTEGQEDG